MEHLTIPQGYVSPLTIRETEVAIKEDVYKRQALMRSAKLPFPAAIFLFHLSYPLYLSLII